MPDPDVVKSSRQLSGEPLTDLEMTRLLSAIFSSPHGMPYGSAGALYPVHAFALRPTATEMEIWYTDNSLQQLILTGTGPSSSISEGLIEQWGWPVGCLIVLAVDFRRVCAKYDLRGLRFATLEAGAISQIIRQRAAALNLGTCIIGGYLDAAFLDIISLTQDWYGISTIIAVGHEIN